MRQLILSTMLLAMMGAGAHAQQNTDRSDAKKFFRAGEQAFTAGQYEMAADAFEQAYRELPLPAIAFSTAQAHRLQYFIDRDPRRLKRAIELYRVYLGEVKSGGRRDDAGSSLAELEPILLRLESLSAAPIAAMTAAQPTTRIMVSTNIKNAQASIDGSEPEAVPLVRAVEPGSHKVSVTAAGYFTKVQDYSVVEGQFRAVEVVMKEKPARVSIRTDAGASISVDGRPVGTAPLREPLPLSAGKHVVSVSQRGRHGWSREIEVDRGESLDLDASLKRTRQRTIAWVVLGTAATAFVGAGLTGLSAAAADSDASTLEDKRLAQGLTVDELAERDRFVANRDDALSATYVLLGAGGALAVSGALLYFMDTPSTGESYRPPSPAAEPIAVAPIAAPDTMGVALIGRF